MAGIIRRTVLKTDLSMVAIELINKGFNRFKFEPFDKNRKFVELRAWRHYSRPDLAKKNRRPRPGTIDAWTAEEESA